MVKQPNKFLAAMGRAQTELVEDPQPEATPVAPTKPQALGRAAQKHVGAYFDKRDPIIERVAILRARLDMTNSELIEHALNELWRKHEAGRAFGE